MNTRSGGSYVTEDGTRAYTAVLDLSEPDPYLPFSMTNLGLQVARNGVASANQYREQARVLGDRVSQVNARIAATAGQNTIRDASYLAQFKNDRGNGLIEPPTIPGPWRDGYVFPELVDMESEFSLFGDQRENMFGSEVFDKFDAALGLINTTAESRGLVNAISVLDRASNIPSIASKSQSISVSGNIASALTNVKGGQAYSILSDTLESTRNLKTVGKALPWIYGAAQVGEEVQFAIDNNLGFEQSAVNVTTRLGGTVVEVAAGTAVIGNATAAGAVIGTFIAPGVGTVIGGAVGATIGTVTYAFTDWLPGVENSIGTNINNAVTNTSREVIGWFQ